MNIFHLLLCIYCLVEENAVTANDKECSSRSETEAGGYFKLEVENGSFGCIKRIKVNKGFRVRMFLMSSKNTFGIEVAESSEGTKSPGQGAFNHNLEMFESKDNEIVVRIDAKSAPLDVQWWRDIQNIITFLDDLLNLVCGGTLDNCSLDYIQIMEVQSEETISRGLICSGILTLKSNKSMRIVFHSDNDSTSGLSFNASWVSKLASPANPVDFDSEVKCNWTISVSPGHTIVINYTLPKTSMDEDSCKSYVQVREGNSDASTLLYKSSTFSAYKSISNTLCFSFMYEQGMNYARFYATWHSEYAQRHIDKTSTTEVGQREGSNGPTKREGSSGSTKAPLVTLEEKDIKVNKTSLSVSDVILQTVAAPMTLVIFIIICLLLVRRAKSMRCFSKEQTAYDTEENMYDSLSEINVEVDNSKLEIRKDIHLRKKSFNPQMFRRRLPTIPTGRLSAILAQVGQRIQFGNDRYDTAYDEAAERQHTEFHESKQEDEHSEQEKLSITNKSTRESFINASDISGDNVDQVKKRSVCFIKSVENDCVINEITVETMNNDGYLTPVDFNSSLTDISTSTLSITNKSTRETFINASYISGDNVDQVIRRSVCSIKSTKNDSVINESTVETMDNDGYLILVDFNSSLTQTSISIADSDSMKLNVAIHHEEDKQLNTLHCIGQDNATYNCMGDFVEAPNTNVCIRLDDGAEGKDLYGGKYETHGKHAAIKETRTDESTDSNLILTSYPGS